MSDVASRTRYNPEEGLTATEQRAAMLEPHGRGPLTSALKSAKSY